MTGRSHDDRASRGRHPRDCPVDDTESAAPWTIHPVSSEGVDLTQIRALLALSPTERVRLLVRTVHRLQRLRTRVRRI